MCDSSSVPVAQTERPVLGSANATELSKAIRGNRYCLGFLCVCVCERERERERGKACKCEREGVRERERETG